MLDASWSSLRHFSRSEFLNPGVMSCAFLHKLDFARGLAGIPFVITSCWRSDSVSHQSGCAVDVKVSSSAERMIIVEAALGAGFRRIGVYDNHVHLDTCENLAEDVLWVGVSRRSEDDRSESFAVADPPQEPESFR